MKMFLTIIMFMILFTLVNIHISFLKLGGTRHYEDTSYLVKACVYAATHVLFCLVFGIIRFGWVGILLGLAMIIVLNIICGVLLNINFIASEIVFRIRDKKQLEEKYTAFLNREISEEEKAIQHACYEDLLQKKEGEKLL